VLDVACGRGRHLHWFAARGHPVTGVDRDAEALVDPGLLGRLLTLPATRVLAIRDGRLPVTHADGGTGLAFRAPSPADLDAFAIYLGRTAPGPGDQGEPTAYVGVVEAPGAGDHDAGFAGLRSIALSLPPVHGALAATLSALANWHATHTHCPRCGAPTTPVQAGWVRRCAADGSDHFPRTDPAVIMAVVDADDRLLLARGRGFTPTGMSVLAGFVEPGETLAEAVAREVAEEVGVTVTEVEYVGDQPWPFPTGLMIGFRARARDTALRLRDGEIEAARWFTRAELDAALGEEGLRIPGRASIARRLIEDWYGAPLEAPDTMLRR